MSQASGCRQPSKWPSQLGNPVAMSHSTNHQSRENRPSTGSNNANRGQSTEKEVSVNKVILLFKPLR
ncbi:hypothetical protein Gotur_010289, partial [Gossypium turneri]